MHGMNIKLSFGLLSGFVVTDYSGGFFTQGSKWCKRYVYTETTGLREP
jgi:hypothetical protein